MLHLHQRYQHLGRYREIARILVKHGFDNIVEQLGLVRYLGWPLRFLRERPEGERPNTAARVRLAVEELGPTFIKLAQILSTRPDLVPPSLLNELIKLQDQVPPAPWEEVREQAEAELGAPLSDIFAEFDEAPLAAASLGQVHAATLKSGEEVVVKIMRPGIEEVVEADLEILADLATIAQERTRLGRVYDFPLIVEDFAFTLRGEMDYRREARNADRFRADLAELDTVYIPKVYHEHTTRRVLTLERIRGIRIDHVQALDEAGINRAQVARNAADIAMMEVFENGFFHADPHPGNFYVMEDGIIGVMDFGMMGYISAANRLKLSRLFISAVRLDPEGMVDQMIRMDAVGPGVDRSALQRDLQRLLNKYYGTPLAEVRVREVIYDFYPVVFRHQIQFPSEYWLLAKSIAMMEGLGVTLDPDFEVMDVAQPYVRRLARRLGSPAVVLDGVVSGLGDWNEFLLYLPRQLPRVMESVESGNLRIRVHVDDMKEALNSLDRMTNRLAVGILMAGFVISLSLLLVAFLPEGLRALGRWLVALEFLSATGMGAWLMFSMWRSRRK